ncbi:TIGR01777 family oxidoreductase [Desulfovibrio inopinatus]|uniref:TIGR01777 family oxidoreductase n=1 Tax=Desulfovibrio inopinatus TaxID=102109 RepID=UPI000427AD7F|nr:TIGR01777 family oxidoreductase [Desulfovibrio inopinatus]
MHVIIAGGSGFIGSALTRYLTKRGIPVTILTRSRKPDTRLVFYARWDGKTADGWGELVDSASAIVNLAGDNIGEGRWTVEKKKRILDSRLQAGQAVMHALNQAKNLPRVLIQASAVGYYGNIVAQPGKIVDESTPKGTGFLSDVAAQWEESTALAEDLGIRRAIIRTGVVLGRQGGALKEILPFFQAFIGGPFGNGHQGFPWIHLRDEIRAIAFLMENENARGPFNLTSPDTVDMNRFAQVLGQVLHRPSLFRVPGFALRAILGEKATEMLLHGNNAFPQKLLDAGFDFSSPQLQEALHDIVS